VELGTASLYWVEDVVMLVSDDKEPQSQLKRIVLLSLLFIYLYVLWRKFLNFKYSSE
jgi:hypothetical protein